MAKPSGEEMWRQMLTGDYPGLQRMRRMWGALPSDPRCKLCNAPFRGPGGVLMRMLAFGPSPLNRRLCRWCIRSIHKHPGGAEIEVTVLFVDVRGSTTIAEELPPGEYSKLLARFYGVAAEAIDEHNGIVDKFVGDGALALFIPGFAGSEHAAAAISAARDLMDRTGSDGPDPWVPIGIGIHTGQSFVGSVGEGDALDFTALGDTVNVASRLTGLAAAGETLVSAGAAEAGHLETARLERRTLELRGRDRPLDAWVAVAPVEAPV